jgi:hypothetical protein
MGYFSFIKKMATVTLSFNTQKKMSSKKRKSQDLKRLGDPIGKQSPPPLLFLFLFLFLLHMFSLLDDILKRNLYLTKMNKLADHHLGKDSSCRFFFLVKIASPPPPHTDFIFFSWGAQFKTFVMKKLCRSLIQPF